MFTAMLVTLVLAQSPSRRYVDRPAAPVQCPNGQCPNAQGQGWGGDILQHAQAAVVGAAPGTPEDRRELRALETRRRQYLVWQRAAARAAARRQYAAFNNNWGDPIMYVWMPPQMSNTYILPPVYSHH
jgi:hypothetical protein